MKLIALPPESRAYMGATHKCIVAAADVAAIGAAAAGTLQLVPKTGATGLPAGTWMKCLGGNLITAFDFSDSGINSLTFEVGDDGDPNRLLTSWQVALDGTEILYQTEGAVTQPFVLVAANAIDLTATAAGGASPLLSECTSGEAEIYFEIKTFDDLERAR